MVTMNGSKGGVMALSGRGSARRGPMLNLPFGLAGNTGSALLRGLLIS